MLRKGLIASQTESPIFMGKFKQSQNQQRHEFLLTFFKKDQLLIEVNGFILKKQFNPTMKVWQVAIYTKDSYSRAEDYLNAQSHLDSIKQETLNRV